MQRRLIAPALSLCVLLLSSQGILAKEQPSPLELDTIVVNAMRIEQKLMDVPLSMSVVGEEEIRRNPQTSIGAILESVPGVTLDDGGSTGSPRRKRISLRGMDPENVVVLIDGVRQKSISGQDGLRGSIFLSPNDIERIEVIKGPASVLYGSDAIAGVINIITKKGGNKPIGVSTSFAYESSADGFEPHGAVFGSYNGFTYRVSGSGTETNNRRTHDGTRLRNTSATVNDYRAYLGYDWEKGAVAFSAENYRANEDRVFLRNDQGTFYPTNNVKEAFTGGNLKSTRKAYTGRIELKELNTVLEKISLNAYWQELDVRFDQSPLARFAGGIWDSRDTTPAYGFGLQTNWRPLESHQVIAGVEYDRISGDGKVWNRSKPKNQLFSSAKGNQQTMAVFLQDTWTILPELEFTVGGRQTWIKTELEDGMNPTGTKLKSSSVTDNHPVFSAGLVYSGIEDFAFRASFSQGYSAPNLNELYGRQRRKGNTHLKPEKSNNYEIGVRYDDGSLNLDTALFYSTLTDTIDWVPIKPVGGYAQEYQNFPKGKLWGAESSISYTISDLNLTPYGSILLKRHQRQDDSGIKTFNTGTPFASGKTGIKWETDVFKDDTFYSDLGLFFASPSKKYGLYRGKYVNSDRKESSTRLDLTLGYEGGTEFKYTIAFSLNNIFDQAYEANGYDGPGRHFLLSLGLEW